MLGLLFPPPVLLADWCGEWKRRNVVVFRGKAKTGASEILYRVPFLVKSFLGIPEIFWRS
jgi:hypothetical protein